MKPWLATAMFAAALAAASVADAFADAKPTLRWTSRHEPATLDPHTREDRTEDALAANLFDPLVRRGLTGELEPALALSWRTLDPLTWEFRLRAGVRFHDGTLFSPVDVAFSLARAATLDSDVRRFVQSIARVHVAGAQTVRIVTHIPNPILPRLLTQVAIVPKAWAEAHGAEEPEDAGGRKTGAFVRNAIGTGPYRLEAREPGRRIVLSRNPLWWGWGSLPGSGNVEVVVFRPLRSALRRANALFAGEVDLATDLAVFDLHKVRKDPRFKLVQATELRTIFLGLDQGSVELRSSGLRGRNPFADKRVRQAMQMAIDLSAIQRVVMRGLAQPAGLPLPPGVRGYAPALDKPAGFNLPGAHVLMKQAGYESGFTVRLDCPGDRYANDEQICLALVGMLGRIGIRVRPETLPAAQHLAKIRSRRSDFYLLGWGVPTTDAHYVLSYLYAARTDAAGLWNATGYANPKMEELIGAMGVEIDPRKRDALVAEALKLAKDDLVYLPLHHQVIIWAMVKGLELPLPVDGMPEFRRARIGPAKP